MERYTGQPLGERPHIAVLFADKLGGFIVATPLLRAIKDRYPEAVLDYFGGDRTAELESALSYIDSRISIYGPADALDTAQRYAAQRMAIFGSYDLAINLDFSALNARVTTSLEPRFVVGRAFLPEASPDIALASQSVESAPLPDELPFLKDDPIDRLHTEFWSAPDLLVRYQGILESSFIGEIFCKLARFTTDYHRTEAPTAEPPFATPDILIATGATRLAKLWEREHWRRAIELLDSQGLSVGLLGGAPNYQKELYGSAADDEALLAETPLIDLRGKLTLPEVAGALLRSRGCLTVDNGIMHISYSVGAPTVAVFGASPIRVWVPKLPNLSLVLPIVECALCEENRFHNNTCLRDKHYCLISVTPEMAVSRLNRLMARAGTVGQASPESV